MSSIIWEIGILAVLLSLSVTAAEITSYALEYNLVADKAVAEITLHLDNFHSGWELPLPRDAVAIDVPGRQFEVVETEEKATVLRIGGEGLFNTLTVNYITDSVIEKTKDRFFILDLAGIEADERTITVKLPEKATLKYRLDSGQASIIPAPGQVQTDGKQIIISWTEQELAGVSSLLVIYSPLPRNLGWIWLVAGLVAVMCIGVGVGAYSWRKRGRKEPQRIADGLTKNLFEDEKKIMEVLLTAKGNELWQKELALKSGLSKVKLSRKLRSLEQKGLVEKIPYGNTNKIRVVTSPSSHRKETQTEEGEGDTEKMRKEEKYFTKLE